MRLFRLIGRSLPALVLLGVMACEDELNEPQVQMCTATLPINTTVPGTLGYLVAVDGTAIVRSVSYTTPAGELTVTSPPDPGDGLVFDESVVFDAPVEAELSVEGEVAGEGQIGLSFTFIPEDSSLPPVGGTPVLCRP